MFQFRLQANFLIGLSLVMYVCLVCPAAYGETSWSTPKSTGCPTAHTPAPETPVQTCAQMQDRIERTGLLVKPALADFNPLAMTSPEGMVTRGRSGFRPVFRSDLDSFAKSHPSQLYLLNRTLLL